MTDFYTEDLAYIHHVGYGHFAQGAGGQILGLLQDRRIDRGLVIDLGCGSGIWARRLLQAGYQALGVDISAAMLDLARQHAPQGRFVQASAYDVALPACQAVTALGEVLCYGSNGVPDDTQVQRLFDQVAARLAPDGLFLFDVMVTGSGESLDYRAWQTGVDWAVLMESSEQQEAGQLTRDITLFREIAGCYRRTRETHQVRVFDPDRLQDSLRASGFDVKVSDHYGDFPLDRRRLAFLASKSPR